MPLASCRFVRSRGAAPAGCAVSAIEGEKTWREALQRRPVPVTLLPNHMTLIAGLPNRVARVAYHLKPQRGRYGEEGKEVVEEKSQKEEIVEYIGPGGCVLPGPDARLLAIRFR